MKHIILAVALLSSFAFAAPSAKRYKNESWREARARTGRLSIQFNQDNAYSVAKPLNQIDFAPVTNLSSEGDLMQIFEYVRDTRFIRNQKSPIENRRLSWLYPDDGCYVRAELMADYTEKQNLPPVMKVFAFGNLAVKTRNTSEGMVRWWYHVAPVYRVNQNVYVMDPAIEPAHPLTMQQWKARISVEGEVNQFALCSEHTFDPDDSCASPIGIRFESVVESQKYFQSLEWLRIQELGRNPYKEL